MQKKFRLLIFFLSLLFLSNNLIAKDIYSGFGVDRIDLEIDSLPKATINSPSFFVGLKYENGFSFEGRVGFGLGNEDNIDILGQNVEAKIDYYLGIYSKYEKKFNNFYPYVLIGVTQGKATLSSEVAESLIEDDSDLSYGVGLDYKFADNAAIKIEYFNALSKSDFDVSAINLGIKFYY